MGLGGGKDVFRPVCLQEKEWVGTWELPPVNTMDVHKGEAVSVFLRGKGKVYGIRGV